MMNQRVFLSLLLIGALLLGMVPAAAAQTETTLIVAYIGASRGSQAATDQLLYQAAVLAAGQINEPGDGLYTGGVAGPDGEHYRFEVMYYPADSDSEALEALAEAVADGAIAALGPDPAGRVSAILEAGTPAIPVLYGAPDAPAGSGYYDNAFHLSAGYDDWAEAVADYLVDEHGLSQIAVAAMDTEAAQTNLTTFVDAVGAAGASVILNLTHTTGADDLYADAMEVRTSDAEAVFIWTLDAQAALLLGALQTIGWDGLTVYAGLDENFASFAGADLAAGTAGPVSWSAAAYDPLSQNFVDAYQARWDAAPPDHAAAYYDAMYLLAEAVAAAGDASSDIATALSNISGYYGVQGVYNGAQTDDLRMVQFTAGGALVEAAHYTAGVCANCPDTWWEDTYDVTDAGSGIVTLALVATLDGAAKERGQQAEQAAGMAVREINNAGGVIGPDGVRYMLFLEPYNATTADEAAAAFTQAANAGASAILGPDYNAQVTPNLLLASQTGVPQLVTATDAWIPESDPTDFVFQVRPNDAALAAAAAAYMLDASGFTDFATVAVRTDYALGAVNALTDVIVETDDGQLVRAIEHGLGDDDFAGMAAQIVASGAQGVFLWTTPTVLSGLMAEMEAQGWTGTFIYGYLTPDLLATLNVPAGIELLGPVNWWSVEGGAWTSQQFAENYTGRYGASPTSLSAAYYDAVYLVAYAIQQAGPAPADIQAWLASATLVTGVQGMYRPATYGQGEMTRSVMLVNASGQEVYEVARYDGTVCLAGCGEVVMGVGVPLLLGAVAEETTTTTTVVATGLPIDLYPTYTGCQYLDNFNYACSGWVNVEGGTAPYTVTIDGQETTYVYDAALFTVQAPRCNARLYDAEVLDAYGQTYKETFIINPTTTDGVYFPGGACEIYNPAPAGGSGGGASPGGGGHPQLP